MRIVAIDYGDRRTGVAVSDPFGWTAQGLEAIVGNMDHAAARVAAIVAEYGARTVVLGYPLNMDGTAGARAARTDAFLRKLSEKMGVAVEVVRWDERLTSVQAERALREASAANPRKGDDAAKRRKGEGEGAAKPHKGASASRRRATGANGARPLVRGEGGTRVRPSEARKGAVDIVSATILLQSYLDSRETNKIP